MTTGCTTSAAPTAGGGVFDRFPSLPLSGETKR